MSSSLLMHPQPADDTQSTVQIALSRQRLEVTLHEHHLLQQCVSPHGENSLYAALADQLSSSLSAKWLQPSGVFRLLREKLGPSDYGLLRRSLRNGSLMEHSALLSAIADVLQSDLAIYGGTFVGPEERGVRIFRASRPTRSGALLRLAFWLPHHFDSLRTEEEGGVLRRRQQLAGEFERKLAQARDTALAELPDTESEKRLAQCLKQAIPPPVTVGLLGDTAQGKSSLLNACFDSVFLPIGDLGPCTACVIQLEANNSPKFQVRIEFATMAELATDFATFFELAEKKNRTEAEKRMIKSLAAKVECLLGRRMSKRTKTFPDPVEQQAIKEGHGWKANLLQLVCQGSATFEIDKLDTAYNILVDFTIMPKDLRKAYQHTGKWPVVREVRISGPIPHLPIGVCVLDLPGLNDSNLLRIQKTKKALQACQHVFLVDDVQSSFQRGSAEALFELIKQLDFKRLSAILTKWDAKCEDRAVIKTYQLDRFLGPELPENETSSFLRHFAAVQAEQLVRSKFVELLGKQSVLSRLATNEDRERAVESAKKAQKALADEEKDDEGGEASGSSDESDWDDDDDDEEEEEAEGEGEATPEHKQRKKRCLRKVSCMTVLPVSARACEKFQRSNYAEGFLKADDTGVPKLRHKFQALAQQRLATMEAHVSIINMTLARQSGQTDQAIPSEEALLRFAPKDAIAQAQNLLATHLHRVQHKLQSYDPLNEVHVISRRGNWHLLQNGAPPTLWCAIRGYGQFTSKAQHVPERRRGRVLLNDDIAEGFVDTFLNELSDLFDEAVPSALRFLESWLMNVVNQVQRRFPKLGPQLQSAANAAWTSSVANFQERAEALRSEFHTTSLREVVLQNMTPLYKKATRVYDRYLLALCQEATKTLAVLRKHAEARLQSLIDELSFFHNTFDTLRQFFSDATPAGPGPRPPHLVLLIPLFEGLVEQLPSRSSITLPVSSSTPPRPIAPPNSAPRAPAPLAVPGSRPPVLQRWLAPSFSYTAGSHPPPLPPRDSGPLPAPAAVQPTPSSPLARNTPQSPARPSPGRPLPRPPTPEDGDLQQALLRKFATLQLAQAEEENDESENEADWT